MHKADEIDIAGANGHGWKSILLRTGVYEDAHVPPAHTPTTIADDVEVGVRWALDQSLGK
jgi:ribonucleotide monophosphatase NagD (HAD superfamily)